MPKPGYYAVAAGRQVGIYETWDECQAQTKGFSNARFKKFDSQEGAQSFINKHSSAKTKRDTGSYGGKRPYSESSGSLSGVTGSSTNNHQSPGGNKRFKSEYNSNNHRRVNNTSYSRASSNNKQVNHKTNNYSRSYYYFMSVHFDGGARGNPGLAGAGAVIVLQNYPPVMSTATRQPRQPRQIDPATDWRKTIHVCDFVGDKHTNNVAEYRGLLAGLITIKRELGSLLTRDDQDHKPPDIETVLLGDSKLIIQQLKGKWRCNHPGLQPLYQQAKTLIQEIQAMAKTCSVRFEHVYRDQNKTADGLANLAMDNKQSFITTDEDDHQERMPFTS